MLNKTLLSFIVIIIVTGISCKREAPVLVEPPPPPPPAPTTDFTYAAGQSPFQSRISFTNKSIGATSYMWDFGDNSTSTDSFPIHTYKNGGSYIVKLTANGPGGATKIEKSISVPAPPSKCTITSVVLNSYSTGIDYDAGNYPDLYIIALNKGGFLFNSRATSVYMNSAPTVSRTWSLSPPPTINQLNESIKITFWDLDEVEKGDADDLMEAFVFTPFDYIGEANPYPSKIQLTGNKVTCSLNVSWN